MRGGILVTATEPEEKLDFPADTKEEKRVARVMYQMAREINTTWLQRVEAAEGHEESAEPAAPGTPPRVSCWTCHRGMPEPEMPPAPDRPQCRWYRVALSPRSRSSCHCC